MKIYVVSVGYYERLEQMFTTEQKALAYIASQAEERWEASGLRPLVEDREKFIEREMNKFTITAWDAI